MLIRRGKACNDIEMGVWVEGCIQFSGVVVSIYSWGLLPSLNADDVETVMKSRNRQWFEVKGREIACGSQGLN